MKNLTLLFSLLLSIPCWAGFSVSSKSGSATASVTVTVPATNNVTAVFCQAFHTAGSGAYTPSLSSIKDGGGTSYTITAHSPSGGANSQNAIWGAYRINAPAGSTTLTCTGLDASSTLYSAFAIAFSATGTVTFDTDNGVDQASHATPISTPSIAVAGAGELLYASTIPDSDATAAGGTWTTGSTTGGSGSVDGYILSSASGSTAVNFSDAGNPDAWATLVMAFINTDAAGGHQCGLIGGSGRLC